MLPFFGPSSVRDGVGLGANFLLDPTTYIDPVWRYSLFAVNVVDTRANLLGATDLLSLAALDKYAFTRDAYLQRRRYLIEGSRADKNLPNYEDSESEGEGQAAPKPAAAPAGAAPAAPAQPEPAKP